VAAQRLRQPPARVSHRAFANGDRRPRNPVQQPSVAQVGCTRCYATSPERKNHPLALWLIGAHDQWQVDVKFPRETGISEIAMLVVVVANVGEIRRVWLQSDRGGKNTAIRHCIYCLAQPAAGCPPGVLQTSRTIV
jgi:hypothetical protein